MKTAKTQPIVSVYEYVHQCSKEEFAEFLATFELDTLMQTPLFQAKPLSEEVLVDLLEREKQNLIGWLDTEYQKPIGELN